MTEQKRELIISELVVLPNRGIIGSYDRWQHLKDITKDFIILWRIDTMTHFGEDFGGRTHMYGHKNYSLASNVYSPHVVIDETCIELPYANTSHLYTPFVMPIEHREGFMKVLEAYNKVDKKDEWEEVDLEEVPEASYFNFGSSIPIRQHCRQVQRELKKQGFIIHKKKQPEQSKDGWRKLV